MYYQTQLLPLSDEGLLLHARHFAAYPVGGEDPREAHHGRFAVGRVDALQALRDVAALCTLPRPPSAAEASFHREMARMQGELARSARGKAALASEYERNERAMRHAAALADRATVWLPRRVLASRQQRVLLGFECPTPEAPGSAQGALRLVDLNAGTLLHEPGPGVRSGQCLALSPDGTRMLGWRRAAPGAAVAVVDRRLEAGLPESAALPGHNGTSYLATFRGWIGLASPRGFVATQGTGRVVTEFDLPPGCFGFGAAATPDGRLVALPGDSGAVWLLDLGRPEAPRARRFDPHRGVRRGTPLALALSDAGDWLATRVADELVVTRLADGRSWPIAALADHLAVEASHEGWTVRSPLPAAFAFIGAQLVLADAQGLRALTPGEPPAGVNAIVSEQGRPGARVPVRAPKSREFDALMKAARLTTAAGRIAPHHAPAVLITPRALKKAGWLAPPNAKASPLGASRFGGWPDLPADVAWPLWQGRPMAFLAQIDLAEAHAAEPRLCLPSSGTLLFFAGCAPETFEPDGDPRPHHLIDVMLGTEPALRGAWRVLHLKAGVPLQRRPWAAQPLPQTHMPCALRLTRGGKALPDEHTVAYGRLALDAQQRDDYNELLSQLEPDEHEWRCQLGGYPNLIQGNAPELMCELASRGQSPWRVPQPADPDHDDLLARASEWGLLLQLTSGTDAGFMWGDAGHCYFYGRRAEMAAGRFDEVWVNYEN